MRATQRKSIREQETERVCLCVRQREREIQTLLQISCVFVETCKVLDNVHEQICEEGCYKSIFVDKSRLLFTLCHHYL